MKIKTVKYGYILNGRPAGREAYFSAKAYVIPKKPDKIEFDFKNVKVLSPSWISEFVSLLKKDYPDCKIIYLPSDNPSVSQSLSMLEE